MLIVLVVFYSGLLLFFISGPSMEDIDNLRKVAFVVLLLGIVAAGLLIFLGLPMLSIGPADEPREGAAAPVMDEEEILLEEYLGLSDEEAVLEAEAAGDGAESEPAPGPGAAATCHQCGSQLIEGSQFCHNCGARVA